MFLQRLRQAIRLRLAASSAESVAPSHHIEVIVIDGSRDSTPGSIEVSSDAEVRTESTVSVPVTVMSKLATDIWWLRNWIERAPHEEPDDNANRVRRAMTHLWGTMETSGIQIQDHTGLAYDPGLTLHVLAFQPTPTVDDEVVGETLKPSVYYRGALIQVGEVIVHTPEIPATGAIDHTTSNHQ